MSQWHNSPTRVGFLDASPVCHNYLGVTEIFDTSPFLLLPVCVHSSIIAPFRSPTFPLNQCSLDTSSCNYARQHQQSGAVLTQQAGLNSGKLFPLGHLL